MKNTISARRLLSGLLCALILPSPLTAASIRSVVVTGQAGYSGSIGAGLGRGVRAGDILTTPGMLLPLSGTLSVLPSPTVTPSLTLSPVLSLTAPTVLTAPAVLPGAQVVPLKTPAAPSGTAAPLITGLQTTQENLAAVSAQDKGGIGTQNALNAVFDQTGGNHSFASPAPSAAPSSSFDAILEKATSLFYPNGQTPAVAVTVVPKPEGVPTDGEMHSKMELSPLTNPEREAAVRELFIAAGARPEEIQTQDAGKGKHNIFVVKKGKTDRVVIVGAHHDKVEDGHGTIDNWTGSTMMINLYQAMRDIETEATYVFIGFAREEEGLIGSEAYLRSLSTAQRKKVDSMVNLDTLGVDGTYSWKNNSSRVLLDLIAAVAKKGAYALVEALLNGGDADSSTFLHAGIPAMTVYGASEEVIFDIIHSERDNMTAFSLPHYKNAYLLTLALLKALDIGPVRKLAGAAGTI